MISREIDVFAGVQAIEDSETVDAIASVIRSFASPFGYDRFVLFSVAAAREEAIDQLYWLEGDWFVHGDAIDADTYMRRCPVTRHVFEAAAPFFWTKTGQGEKERYTVVARPKKRGVHGLQIPVFGPAGLEGAVSMGGEQIDSSRGVRLALTVVGEAALRSARGLVEVPKNLRPGRLSEREQQVLRWVATGRRQIDIAAILGLSERTVENHLRRIRLRLGAKTTAEAVRIALREGEIEA